MDLLKEINRAYERIHPHILNTPLLHSPWLSGRCGGDVYLKMESEQYTGSFKARGALNKLMWLDEQANDALPVTASTGNHGLGFARALDLLGLKGKIFLPRNAVSSKVDAIKRYDVALEFYGEDPYDTELYAREQAEKNGWAYVSPYNDLQVIAGQGTIALEIQGQWRENTPPELLVATVGGGGLISGAASCSLDWNPAMDIIGAQPRNSPEMSVSVRAGEYREVDSKPTLSDGSAGGFERDSITFDICREVIDDFILITEEEIAEAIRLMIRHQSKLVEGSSGVAIASLLKEPGRFANKKTVVIVCGANISLEKLKEVLGRDGG